MDSPYLPDPRIFRPLSPFGYFFYGLLFLVPVIGVIAAILIGFLSKNVNLRAYARGFLLLAALMVVLVAIFAAVLYSNGQLPRFLRALPEAFKTLFP